RAEVFTEPLKPVPVVPLRSLRSSRMMTQPERRQLLARQTRPMHAPAGRFSLSLLGLTARRERPDPSLRLRRRVVDTHAVAITPLDDHACLPSNHASISE